MPIAGAIPLALGVGGAVAGSAASGSKKGGGSGGGGGGGGGKKLAKQQAAISQEVFNLTRGLRQGVLGAAQSRLGLPITVPVLDPTEASLTLFDKPNAKKPRRIAAATIPYDNPDDAAQRIYGQSFDRLSPKKQARISDLMSQTQARVSDIEESSIFGPGVTEREALENAFSQARENIISRTPARGGQLNEALIDLETDRARSLTSLQEQGQQQALGIATGTILGPASLAVQGTGSAAGLLGQQAAAQAQIAQQQDAAKGSMIQGLAQAGAIAAKAFA